MIVIGIDPGLSGCVAAVHSTDGYIGAEAMPLAAKPKGRRTNRVDIRALARIIADFRRLYPGDPSMGVIEEIQSRGGSDAMSGIAVFGMGYAFGIAHALLAVRTDELIVVSPRRWKAHYGLDANKAESVACARRLYGSRLPTQFGHNRAEALLIAHWGLGVI